MFLNYKDEDKDKDKDKYKDKDKDKDKNKNKDIPFGKWRPVKKNSFIFYGYCPRNLLKSL